MMAGSLMNLACSCVIENIDLVDCLDGLPELIGEYIFRHLLDSYFATKNRIKLQQGLRVFAKSYGPLILKQLNLSSRLLIINEYVDCLLPLISNVVALDLNHCHLGINHEVMQLFIATDMTYLQILSLKDCALTDETVRKLTIPCRIYKKGLIHLQELDLSCNSKLTAKSLQFLICLTELKLVILSGTSILPSEAELFGRKNNFSLKNDNNLSCSFQMCTEGWAKNLIEQWISDSNTVSEKKSISKNANSTAAFYSHRRIRLEIIRELKTSLHQQQQPPSICLIRKKSSSPTSDLISDYSTDWNGVFNPEGVGIHDRLETDLESPIMKQGQKRKMNEMLGAVDNDN